jgi:hypothetical protein
LALHAAGAIETSNVKGIKLHSISASFPAGLLAGVAVKSDTRAIWF